jgi:type IV pilus assembly protein PilV
MPQSASRRCNPRLARGFTLIEVMIAATILAVGLLALAGMQVSAIRGGKQGRHTTEAAAAARSQLEQFDRMNFLSGSLNATAGWVAPTPVSNAGNTVQSTNGTVVEEAYNLQWRITDVDPNNTKSIDVQVTWTDNTNGQQKTLVLSTMKYNTFSE